MSAHSVHMTFREANRILKSIISGQFEHFLLNSQIFGRGYSSRLPSTMFLSQLSPLVLWPVPIIRHALFSLIFGCLQLVVRASCLAALNKPTEEAVISHGLEILSCLPGVLFLIWRLLTLHFAEAILVKLKIF